MLTSAPPTECGLTLCEERKCSANIGIIIQTSSQIDMRLQVRLFATNGWFKPTRFMSFSTSHRQQKTLLQKGGTWNMATAFCI